MIQDHKAVFSNRDQYIRNFPSLTLQELEHFIDTVRSYKKSYEKVDYTDLLELFLMEGNDVNASHVIVDEAQDLSPLQWAVVRKISTGTKELHIAGDDDQAIHEWNGAAPKLFIEHRSDEYQVLPQSYRIPATVHVLASKVVDKIKTRLPKTYKSREALGSVERFSSMDDLRFAELFKTDESWFMLVRNHSLSPAPAKFCRDRGLLMTGVAGGLPSGIIAAIQVWNRLVRLEKASKEEVLNLYQWMSTRDRIKYGAKGELQKSDKTTFTLDQLQKENGLIASKDLTWFLALDKITPEDAIYLQAAERNGPLDRAPRIEIATIHAVKGREADNVLIIPDMTYQTHQAFVENEDAEHRVWYVGVTRAKKRVVIINPSSKYYYNL
jgi:DNA helicase-2/ATP-dependent DNA helicase PcrA